MVFAASLNTTIGHCVYVADFISDLEENLRKFNEEFTKMNGIKMNSRKKLEMQLKFVELVKFYSDARE